MEYGKLGNTALSVLDSITLIEMLPIFLDIYHHYIIFELIDNSVSKLILFVYFSYMLIFTKNKKYISELQKIKPKLSQKHKKLLDLIIELYDKIEINKTPWVSRYCYAKKLSIPRLTIKDWRSFLDDKSKDIEPPLKDSCSFILLDALFISFETLKYNLLRLIRKTYDKKIKDLLIGLRKLMYELQDKYNRILIRDFIINYIDKDNTHTENIRIENIYEYLNNLLDGNYLYPDTPDICLFVLKHIKNKKPVKI